MTKTFEFYMKDLTPECQKRFTEFLGDDGNYDYFPFCTFEIEDDKEGEEEDA